MGISIEKKVKIAQALLAGRANYSGSDIAYGSKFKINASVFSQIKTALQPGGDVNTIAKLLKEDKWIDIAMEFNVVLNDRQWVFVETEPFLAIKSAVQFCKEASKFMFFVDECEVGKTVAARYLANTLPDCFYIDASQCKDRRSFVRTLSRTLGLGEEGSYAKLLARIKAYLCTLTQPIVIIDEGGDLEYKALLEIKALWNATEGRCGWYMMGADGLRELMEQGIARRKVGFREIFSRGGGRYDRITPIDKKERREFQIQLLNDVIAANVKDKSKVKKIVNDCLANDSCGTLAGLRRAETLIIQQNQAA